MFDLTTHSTHFIYGDMTSRLYDVDILWVKIIQMMRDESRCSHSLGLETGDL